METGVHGEQIPQAAGKQERSDQENERERDLGYDQRLPQAKKFAAPGKAAAARLHGVSRGNASRPQRRHQAEQKTSQTRQTRGKGEHARIRVQIQEQRVPFCAEHRHQEPAQRAGQEQSQCRAGCRKQEAFGHQLPDEAATRRSDGQPYRDFVTADGGARQQQVGEVGTSDQENQPRRYQQQQQRIAIPAAQP